MQGVYARLEKIVPSSEPVILEGETGTGKELVARLIHDRGPRSRHSPSAAGIEAAHRWRVFPADPFRPDGAAGREG